MLDRVAGKLEQYLDLLGARQKLVTSNIANADTPGFKTRDINFQTEFLNAVAGVATFSDLSLNKVGSGYTLLAASTGLTGATSSTFDIVPGT